jgi:hypothetical protein
MKPRELTWMSSCSVGTEEGGCVELAISDQATAVPDAKAFTEGQLGVPTAPGTH